MRQIHLPETAVILENPKFWNPRSFTQFLERCNDTMFENPHHGLEEALHAPRFVVLCGDDPVLFVRAHAVLASGYRATGNYHEAEQAFERALDHGRDLPELDLVDVYRRLAILRRNQRDWNTAFDLVNKAIRVYRLHGDVTDTHFLGECYQVRGMISLERGWFSGGQEDIGSAFVDSMKALSHLTSKRDPKVYFSTVHNLAIILTKVKDHDALDLAMRYLTKARRALYRTGHNMAKYKLQWIQGLLHNRFGTTRQGERLLLSALDGLIDLGAAYEVALISLDLALLYVEECEPPDVVAKLARDTYTLFQSMAGDEPALAALTLWKDTTQEKITLEFLRSLRQTVEQQATPAVG